MLQRRITSQAEVGIGVALKSNFGVGATEELNLRVSVASLARVVFEHPPDRHPMLALERVATLRERESGQHVTVKAQPFGGAVRLRDVSALRALIGDFHFDSGRSRAEGDFRIQIRPSDWERLRFFCLQHLQGDDESVLEAGPERELVEEFSDALHIQIAPAQYRLKRMGLIVENEPTNTDNVHATHSPTVRIYSVFEARILDPTLARAMLRNSERYSDQDLDTLALQDARRGGKGRANAILALPMALLVNTYRAMSPETRNAPVTIEGHYLDANVPAVLGEVSVPRFQRLSQT